MMRTTLSAIYQIILAAVLAISAAQPVFAEGDPYPGSRGNMLIDKPVQFAGNGKYYEMIQFGRTSWDSALMRAQQTYYNGIPGTLATIDSLELQHFLVDTFKPLDAVFFGLRYACGVEVLMLANGDIYSRKSFSYWAMPWHNYGNDACSMATGTSLQPIAIDPGRGFRWVGWNPSKGFYFAFVEFDPARKAAIEKKRAEALAKQKAQPEADVTSAPPAAASESAPASTDGGAATAPVAGQPTP